MSPGKRTRVPEAARRQRTRRLDLTTVLAVVIPVVTVGVLALVQPLPVHDTRQPPSLTNLTNALVVCPSAHPVSPDAAVSTASGSSGSVTVISAQAQRSIHVRTGDSTPVSAASSMVVKGTDQLAPGLLGLRSGLGPVTALNCPVPSPDEWFTGVGARADHDSVFELVNPDAGPAVADITFLGTHSFSARRLRGVTIPGHKTVSLDLGKLSPRRALLTAHVVVSRGRLGVNVFDTSTSLITHKTQSEWLPPQLVPATSNELLGLPTGQGKRTLQLANPGADVVQANVKVVTRDTSFTPKGMKPVSIPPGATIKVPLTRVLAQALKQGVAGISVEADAPVTASILTSLATDRVLTVPDDAVRQEAATLLPVVKGRKGNQVSSTLYLSGEAAGSADVTAYDAAGKRVLHTTVAQQQGRTVKVSLPAGTAFLRVVPHRTPVHGAVLVTGRGASVIPLHELLTRGLVPQIARGQD